ncbi:TetR/AcrR family transcriptional regulator [Acetobacterium bakii]|uniref:AcrR family transcriptional regulator n=1 Tax=Acetobacterium bakii TaxID=52689 RepID=A0A0L6U2J4_9FIRM|nr:TetR/AcrR family transcriptional regulator [Acetobacterium bakii]KNZ42739.1 AcrR family transcriptional regulator [Acetobacterium bakii]
MRIKDDEKEQSIKEAVVKLILQEGFHGTSISKIAKEAGVSPATVYTYFDSKEVMLQDIYREYTEEICHYVLSKVHYGMDKNQLIEALIQSYYDYIEENQNIFSFLDQFSNSPSLVNGCSETEGLFNIKLLIADLKRREIIKNYHNENVYAMIFYPIKAIAVNYSKTKAERTELLDEMIEMIKDTLLV